MDIYKLYDEIDKYNQIYYPYVVSSTNMYREDDDMMITVYTLRDDAPQEAVEANRKSYELRTGPDFYLVR